MVVLYFGIGKNSNSTYNAKDYSDFMKRGILKDDANKCIPIEISKLKELQLTSLDNLLKISDEIGKVQHEIESFLKSLEKKLHDLHPETPLMVNIRNKPMKIKEGLINFTWDDQKFPISQKSIESVLERIIDRVNKTRDNLKSKSDDYTAENEKLKSNLKAENEAKIYMKKDYRLYVKTKQKEMIKSDYLTTLLVFVPISNLELFNQKYEYILESTVVPGSALQLCNNDDEKVRLFRVVIMKHKKEDYTSELRRVLKCNSKEYDESEISSMASTMLEQKVIEASLEEKKVSI